MTPPWLNSGWTARLRTIFDAPLSEIAESSLDRLVDHSVREDSDLDFKEALYGNGDSQRRELAADIAAMANDRGGIIVIGICEENDVAVACSPVPLTSGEEGRMRAIGAGNIVPSRRSTSSPCPPIELLDRGTTSWPCHQARIARTRFARTMTSAIRAATGRVNVGCQSPRWPMPIAIALDALTQTWGMCGACSTRALSR